MNIKKLVRPKLPVEFTSQNWARKQDYDNAMASYYNALAIYKMLGGK